MFELMGAFVLTQLNYDGFDFQTHKKAKAIVVRGRYTLLTAADLLTLAPSQFIGTIGGLSVGLVLMIIDLFLASKAAVNDLGTKPNSKDSRPTAVTISEGDGRNHAQAGCVFRMFLCELDLKYVLDEDLCLLMQDNEFQRARIGRSGWGDWHVTMASKSSKTWDGSIALVQRRHC